MAFRVLGSIEYGDIGMNTPLGGPKQRAVLAMLIRDAGRVVSTDSLIDGVWGEDAPGSVRASLHSYISNLRAALGGKIERTGAGYRLDVGGDEIDADVFEQTVDEARATLTANPAKAAESLRAVLSLWRGKPYADLLDVPGLQDEIRRLEDLRLLAVEARIDAELANGRGRAVIGELEALAAEHPLREGFRIRQMIALYRDGRQVEALRAYQQTRDYLAAELGVDPSPELQQLEDRILQQDPSLLTANDVRTEEVSFLFTDLEASTILWETRPELMRDALALHDDILSKAVEASGGRVFKNTGDGVLASFGRIEGAAQAAALAQQQLTETDWGALESLNVRMSVDVGDVDARGGDYFGAPMNRGSRLMSSAHGGQVVMSESAHQQLQRVAGLQFRSLGEHRFKGLGVPQQVFQLIVAGIPAEFPDLRVDAASPELGRQFGDAIRGYEIRERIGVGRFGVVYRAYQPSVGREVAVKVIRPEYANHPAFVRRFESEARLVAKLGHPHIVSLYDFWRDHEGAYLVMPYLVGKSLTGAPYGAMPVDRVVAVVRQIGAALAYAHRQGVIHRDVKPANILLDAEGNAYLSDFGIAVRPVEQATGLRPTSQVYRAPEDREGGAIDERSDVYSLAAVTAELLTGTPLPESNLSTLGPDLAALIERGTEEDPQLRFRDMDQFVSALVAMAGGETESAVRPIAVRNPYKGLAAFDEGDARDFFGRAAEIGSLLELVGDERLVTVVGPSGSGKSSLVRAGLVPALRSGGVPGSADWPIVTAVPGSHPFDELATALSDVATEGLGDLAAELRSDQHGLLRVSKRLTQDLGGELVVVIDQFEELYSLVADEGLRAAFVEALIEATEDPHSRLRVVSTIRADFFDQPLLDDRLGAIVSTAHLALSVPGHESLLEAVQRPAMAAGLELEPGLALQIVADVRDQPGGLPLMQFVLSDLAENSDSGHVAISAYTGAGGVAGALSRRATTVYESLGEEDRQVAEQVLLRLVTVSEDVDDTRRRVRRSELERLGLDAGAVDRVLDSFGSARLLTFDRDPITRGPTVEVAHEALLREWEVLRGWIRERREALVVQRRLTLDMEEWEAADRSEDYLATGGRLAQFEEWAADPAVAQTEDERRFLESALERRNREVAERRRRRKRIMGGFAAAAVVALILATAAWVQRGAAEESRSLAVAREWILEADRNVDVDPELSINLALEAIDAFRAVGEVPADAIAVLRRSTVADRVRVRMNGGRFVTTNSDGSLIATRGPDGIGIAIREIRTGDLVSIVGEGMAIGAAFNPIDGGLITATIGEPLQIRRGTGWSDVTELGSAIVGIDSGVELSPDGSLVLSTGVDGFEVFTYTSGESLYSVASEDLPSLTSDGRIAFATPGVEGEVTIFDIHTGECLALESPFTPFVFEFSPDGDALLISDQAQMAALNVSTGELSWHNADLTRPAEMLWLRGGSRILVGNESTLVVLDASSGEVLFEMPGHEGGSFSFVRIPRTDLVASAGIFDNQTLISDVGSAPPPEVARITSQISVPFDIHVGSAGETIHVSNYENGEEAALLDVRTGGVVASEGLRSELNPAYPVSSPGGSFVGVIGREGSSEVRSMDSGAIEYTAPDGWIVRGVSADGSMLVEQRAVGAHSARLARNDGSVIADLEFPTASGRSLPPSVTWADFTPDGRYVLLTVFGHSIALFDTSDGALVNETDAGRSEANRVAFHSAVGPFGEKVAVGRSSGTIIVYDLLKLVGGLTFDDAEIRRIDAHDSFILRVKFSPDGTKLGSVSWNEPARIWDVETGLPFGEFGSPNEGGIVAFGFHPTEPWFYASLPGDVIATYTLDADELIKVARSRLTRELTEEECQRYLGGSCEA